jgi:hypothetical protein
VQFLIPAIQPHHQAPRFWTDVSTCCIRLYLRGTHSANAARNDVPDTDKDAIDGVQTSIYRRTEDLGSGRAVNGFPIKKWPGVSTSIPSSGELIGTNGRLLRHASTCMRIVESSSNVNFTGEINGS